MDCFFKINGGKIKFRIKFSEKVKSLSLSDIDSIKESNNIVRLKTIDGSGIDLDLNGVDDKKERRTIIDALLDLKKI